MRLQVRQSYDRTRQGPGKAFASACYAPFVSLYLNTLGHVVACCRSQSYVVGNVTHDSLEDIWHGPRIRAMRDSLRRYEFGPACAFCEWMIQAGDYQGAMTHHFDWYEVPSPEPEFPRQMEFALANDCNFACIQCVGDWSSRIRSQREGMPPLARVYDDRFFRSLERFLPHLQTAKFFGGEPFLVPENLRVWELMIAAGLRPRCYILTNGSIWDGRVERVLEQLQPSISVSLDAVADPGLLERIRVGARHETLMANIRRFRGYSQERRLPMGISFSLMRQNWTELGPMLLFCEENDFVIDVIRVVDPTHFSLFSLPEPELLRIVEALEAQAPAVRPRLRRLGGTWDEVVHGLRESLRREQGDGYRNLQQVDQTLRHDPVQAASQALERGDWAGVLAEAGRTESTDKDYLHALALMAHAHRRLHQLADAEVLLDRALGLTRRHAPVFVERAWLRLEQNRPEEGMAEAREALATARDGAEGDRLRAWALEAILHGAAGSGRAPEALEAADQLCLLVGDDPDTLLRCARLLVKAGCAQAALPRLRQAIASPRCTPEVGATARELVDQLGQGTAEDTPRQAGTTPTEV